MIQAFELFRLSARGIEVVASPAEVDRAREEFRRQQAILVPNVLTPELASQLKTGLAEAEFHTMVHQHVGTELCATGGRATTLLEVASNRRELFDFIDRLSDAPERLRFFEGRI